MKVRSLHNDLKNIHESTLISMHTLMRICKRERTLAPSLDATMDTSPSPAPSSTAHLSCKFDQHSCIDVDDDEEEEGRERGRTGFM